MIQVCRTSISTHSEGDIEEEINDVLRSNGVKDENVINIQLKFLEEKYYSVNYKTTEIYIVWRN